MGGISPGSMPLARELYQEGLIIPPVLLQRGGGLDEGVLDLITRNSRTPEERLGDLAAQIAAQRIGSGAAGGAGRALRRRTHWPHTWATAGLRRAHGART